MSAPSSAALSQWSPYSLQQSKWRSMRLPSESFFLPTAHRRPSTLWQGRSFRWSWRRAPSELASPPRPPSVAGQASLFAGNAAVVEEKGADHEDGGGQHVGWRGQGSSTRI